MNGIIDFIVLRWFKKKGVQFAFWQKFAIRISRGLYFVRQLDSYSSKVLIKFLGNLLIFNKFLIVVN